MATGTETAASYGISEALLAAHPELVAVFNLFKAENIPGALDALYKTSYYRDLSSTVKSRDKLKLEQPKVWADALDKYKLAAQKRLVASGVQIDNATFDALINKAYSTGLDENQLDQAILTSGKITGFGGNVLGDTTTLKTYASEYGVNNLLNDAYWNQKSKDLFAKTITLDDIQKEIRTLSASAYPAYATGIAAGQSLSAQTSYIKQSIATFLEKDPDTIGYDDPLYKRITQYVDPTSQKPTIMPAWLVEKTVKESPEWAFTKNAQESADTLGLRVLRDMKVIGG
jgi:hypothetical protein